MLHHLVSGITLARGDVEGYCAALEREAGPEGRLLGHAVADGRIEPLWETRPTGLPARRRGARPRDRADRPLALRRGARPRGRLRRADLAGADAGLAGARTSSRRAIEGGPLIGCFGHVNESKRMPAAARGVRAAARTPARRAAARSSARGRRACAELELPEGVIREDYVPEDELWSLLAACDAVVSLRCADDGRDLGGRRSARSRSASRSSSATSAGSAELPDDVAIKVPVGEGEIEALGARARAGGRRARRWAGPRCALARDGARPRPGRRDLYAAALRPRRSEAGPALHEGRLLLADAAVPLGDRRLLGAAPARARASAIDVVVARPGRFRSGPPADVALYHVGNDAEAHGWIVEALRRRPGVVVLHDFVLHHLVVGLTFSRGDAAGYLAAMEREGGLVGRLLAYAVLDNKLPPLWETRPEDFPLAGEVLQRRDRPDRPLALRRGARARDRLRRADRADPAPRLADPRASRRPRSTGDPLFGCFGHLNETKRIAELVARVRAGPRAPPGRAAAARRLARRAARAGSSCPRASSTATTSPRTSSGR